MKPTVYLETTIPSYLTAWPSRDLVRAAHQQITKEWWAQRHEFDLLTSRLVHVECLKGDVRAAQERMSALVGIPIIEQTDDAAVLADALLRIVPLPSKAATDAMHIAISAVNNVRFLVTWNCRHIANAVLRPHIDRVCAERGFRAPIIGTPDQLLTGGGS